MSDRPDECPLPPEGWRCTRPPGHEGPCAAVPVPDRPRDPDEIRHIVPIPDDHIVTHTVEIVGTLDSEGEMGYFLRHHGDVPLTSYVGLLEVGKFDIIEEFRRQFDGTD
jgi:hypothetical protein